MTVLENKRIAIEREMDDMSESVNNETKSSVGDKHETARARMQAEQARLQKQLFELRAQKEEFEKIKQLKREEKVTPGSLVVTDSGVFFVAIALGKLKLGQVFVQVISVRSPFALKMHGLKCGEVFEMNGNTYSIRHIT